MRSHLLAKTVFDAQVIRDEIDIILEKDVPQHYSDFVFGIWKSYVLYNGTGEENDALLSEFEGNAVPTPLGLRLKGIRNLIESSFDVNHLRWARAFVLRDGVLLPHRDFLELKNGFTRLHLPIQTDLTCLHSEEDEVFHMGTGEIWALDARRVHSACNLRSSARVTLCLDFRPDVPISSLLIHGLNGLSESVPYIVSRPPLDEETMAWIRGVLWESSAENFREVVGTLCRVHFERSASAGAVYDWLIQFLSERGESDLLHRAVALRTFAIGERCGSEHVFDRSDA